jgi:hypothetical protein
MNARVRACERGCERRSVGEEACLRVYACLNEVKGREKERCLSDPANVGHGTQRDGAGEE